MITIITRHSKGRKALLDRYVRSINSQTCQDFNVLYISDCQESSRDIESIESQVPSQHVNIDIYPKDGFYWNHYCNLKSLVTDGYFMYCDSDDFLHSPDSIRLLVEALSDEPQALMCQFLRNGSPKPSNEIFSKREIIRGQIGGSCIVCHHSVKDLAYWDKQKGADYRFIRDLAAQIEIKWVPIVVIEAGNSGLKGKQP